MRNKEQVTYFGEEVKSAEESDSNVRVSDASTPNGSLVLHNPKRKINHNLFVPKKFRSLLSRVGFQHVPELPSDPHFAKKKQNLFRSNWGVR